MLYSFETGFGIYYQEALIDLFTFILFICHDILSRSFLYIKYFIICIGIQMYMYMVHIYFYCSIILNTKINSI